MERLPGRARCGPGCGLTGTLYWVREEAGLRLAMTRFQAGSRQIAPGSNECPAASSSRLVENPEEPPI